MSIARSTFAFVGTDETTGTAVANNATANGAEVDVLGNDTSVGDLELYAVITSTVAVGTIDVTINKRRLSGQAYNPVSAQYSVPPINGTIKRYLGRVKASRFMSADAFNNATGASATVAILAEAFKGS